MSFQCSVEDIDEITKRLSFVVPTETVASEYQKAVASVGRTARIKGFRPGKVPRNIIERQFGDNIRYDVVNRLINEALKGAYSEHKLDVVGYPELDFKDFDQSRPFDFSAKVSLYPTPTIENYTNRTVKVVKKEITDEDVERSIASLLESKGSLKPIEGRTQVEKGDVVALGVEIKIGDGEFSRGEPFIDVLGSGKLNPEVEEQVVGLEANQVKEIEVVAKDSTASEDSGEKRTYRVVLHGMFSRELPALDDAFVQALGIGVDTVDALKAKIKDHLIEQAEADLKSEVQGAVLDLLVKENPFKVPASMVDDEIRGLVANYGFAGRGVKPESIDIEVYRPQFEEFALNRIRCAIIIDRVGATEKITVDESDREQMLQRLSEQSGESVESTRKKMLDRSHVMSFLLEVRRTKILEYLVASNTIEYTEGGDAPQVAA